jgi:hypothetical protein
MRLRALLLAFTIASAGAVALDQSAGAGTAGPKVLVELFTSQGCSECPPADRIIGELAGRRDVIALTFPITYWDMLGWKDTFATEANTRRQKAYAKAMKRSGLTTPQLVVGGTDQVFGHQRDKIMAAISAHTAQVGARFVPIALAIQSDHVDISISAAPGALPSGEGEATIWVMRTLSRASVVVGGGENNKRELAYTNVVRELQRAGTWDGSARTLRLPVRAEAGKQDGIAVVVQRGEYGAVIGAAFAQLP